MTIFETAIIEIIAIAAAASGLVALFYLIWLTVEEHAVKRYLRERDNLVQIYRPYRR